MSIPAITPITASAAGISGITPIGNGLSPASQTQATGSFLTMIGSALGNLSSSMATADNLAVKMAAGEDVDLHQVMIAMETASIGLQTALTVRNKAVDAYKEIMAMPL